MNTGIPILMISLQIPVLPDTDAEEVLQAIAMQVSQALDAVREQQAGSSEDEPVDEVVRESSETFEAFTDGTKDDLLASLGYAEKSEE